MAPEAGSEASASPRVSFDERSAPGWTVLCRAGVRPSCGVRIDARFVPHRPASAHFFDQPNEFRTIIQSDWVSHGECSGIGREMTTGDDNAGSGAH